MKWTYGQKHLAAVSMLYVLSLTCKKFFSFEINNNYDYNFSIIRVINFNSYIYNLKPSALKGETNVTFT